MESLDKADLSKVVLYDESKFTVKLANGEVFSGVQFGKLAELTEKLSEPNILSLFDGWDFSRDVRGYVNKKLQASGVFLDERGFPVRGHPASAR